MEAEEPAVAYYPNMDAETYLKWEDAQQTKHEYLNGKIVAMSGASKGHNRILTNLLAAIGTYLKGKICEIFPSDLRLAVKSKNSYFYPNATIVCNKTEYSDNNENTITNPSVIFEILSPSTSNINISKKLFFYMQIESLKEYILIDSLVKEIHIARRNEEGLWKVETFFDDNDRIFISAIDYYLALKDIYNRLGF